MQIQINLENGGSKYQLCVFESNTSFTIISPFIVLFFWLFFLKESEKRYTAAGNRKASLVNDASQETRSTCEHVHSPCVLIYILV